MFHTITIDFIKKFSSKYNIQSYTNKGDIRQPGKNHKSLISGGGSGVGGGMGGGDSKGGGGGGSGYVNGGGAGQYPHPLSAFRNSSNSLCLETHFI